MEKIRKKVLEWQKSNRSNLKSEKYSELLRNEKIKEFLDESKKSQTLYANCEGSFNRRVMDTNNQKNLKQFIYSNLFYSENFYYMETDETKSLIVHEIVETMVKLSRQFATPNEIHFSVIWVYYYEYESGETKATPLFKIYKTTNTEEAVFLDIFLNPHDSWEYYLENAVLSNAFLCVPRNGNYTFITEIKSLDLMYVIKKEKEGILKYTGPLILPFSERVVRKLLSSFRLCSEHIKEGIKSLMNVLKVVWEHKEKFMLLMMLLLKVWLRIHLSMPLDLKFLNSTFEDFGRMFLNNGFSLDQDSELTSQTSNGNSSFAGPVQTVNTDYSDGLIAASRSLVDDLLSSKHAAVVKNVLSVIEIIFKVIKVIKASRAGLQNNGTEDEIAPLTFSDLKMRTDTEISPNSTMLKKCSSNLEEDKVKVKAIQLMLISLEEIEEKPFETIREKVYEEAKSIECRETLPSYSPLTIPAPCDFPGKFYIFTDASLPLLTKEISLIFNNFSDDWSFKPINDKKYHVIDNEGRVLGKFYCIDNSFVLAYMIEDKTRIFRNKRVIDSSTV